MDYCPHCGEKLAADATACPHCGSDAETGWNPEAEYYSVELPEDDTYEVHEESPVRSRVEGDLPGVVLLGLAALFLFVAMTRSASSEWESLIVAVVLALGIWIFFRQVATRA